MGTRFGTIVPYRGFPTADRDIVIAVASNKLWIDFCGAIGRPDLATNPDYETNALRVKNRDVLEPLISSIFRTNQRLQNLFGQQFIDLAMTWDRFGASVARVRVNVVLGSVPNGGRNQPRATGQPDPGASCHFKFFDFADAWNFLGGK